MGKTIWGPIGPNINIKKTPLTKEIHPGGLIRKLKIGLKTEVK